MAGFSSAGFSSAGFSALDITTNLDRHVAEMVGGFVDAQLGRALVDVLMAPELFHANLDRYSTEVLMDPPPPLYATADRYVIEVLAVVPFVAPAPESTNYRITAEVLGLAAAYIGKHAELSRAVAEVLMDARSLHRGLYLPAVAVNGVTLVARFTADWAAGPGYLGLLAEDGDGFELTWPGDGTNYTLTWVQGGVADAVPGTITGDDLTVAYTSAGNGTPVALTSLGLIRPEGITVTGELRELMLLDHEVDPVLLAQYRSYMNCHWTPGCTSRPTPCTEAPPPGVYHWDIVMGSYFATYWGFVRPPFVDPQVGTCTPDDGNLLAIIGLDENIVQCIVALPAEEELTELTVTIAGNDYSFPGSVTEGSAYGHPFVFIAQAISGVPAMGFGDGVAATIDVH